MGFDTTNLKRRHIRHINSLVDLKEDEMARFLSYATFVTYKANETVFETGSDADCMLLLVEGQMRVMSRKPNKKLYFLRYVQPGESLGEIAMIDGGVRSATIETVKDSVVLKLDGVSFEKLLREEPSIGSRFLLRIAVQLCSEMRDLTKRISVDSSLRDALGLMAT